MEKTKLNDKLEIGTWYVTEWTSHNHIHVSEFDGANMVFIADFGSPIANKLPHNPNAKRDAEFLETCHATCCAVNSSNPQVVAENIKTLADTLKEAKLQIEYLDEKFTKTGTSQNVLTKIDMLLEKLEMKNE
jgi:hypothetical protein